MKTLKIPSYWYKEVHPIKRIDGVIIMHGISKPPPSVDGELVWIVTAPVTGSGVSMGTWVVPAKEGYTLQEIMQAVDVTWPPPAWLVDATDDWLGTIGERIARMSETLQVKK